MPSNSLIKDFQANSSQLNRLVTNKLKVNSLSLNDVNNSNVSPDDILLVLITLNILDANLYADRIEFKVDNLKLTEWEKRPVGNTNAKYNKHYNYKHNEALEVLKNLWNDDYQGKYSASLNNPNAILTILIPEELFTDHYIIIKNYDVNDNLVTIYIESQEESPEIKPMKNVPLKIVIDDFQPFTIFGGIRNSLEDTLKKINNADEGVNGMVTAAKAAIEEWDSLRIIIGGIGGIDNSTPLPTMNDFLYIFNNTYTDFFLNDIQELANVWGEILYAVAKTAQSAENATRNDANFAQKNSNNFLDIFEDNNNGLSNLERERIGFWVLEFSRQAIELRSRAEKLKKISEDLFSVSTRDFSSSIWRYTGSMVAANAMKEAAEWQQ
jgi:hypothetical protein